MSGWFILFLPLRSAQLPHGMARSFLFSPVVQRAAHDDVVLGVLEGGELKLVALPFSFPDSDYLGAVIQETDDAAD